MMKRIVVALSAAILLASGMAGAASKSEAIDAVATIGMIGNVVEEVGGACVDVPTLMGAGIDPHTYRATAQDVRTFQSAGIIFFSGYNLEGQLGKVLDRMGESRPVIATAPASIAPDELIRTQGAYGIDPHLWMDVSLWAQIVPTIREQLIDLRPDCAERFQANAEGYKKQLTALDGWVEATIASIPEEQRVLVTAHDAFGYYGRAYGIGVAGIQGLSTESQAGIADIQAMAQAVAERNVPAVFIESTINPRTVQAVVDAAEARGQPVEIGGELYSDAMGASGEVGGNYIGMIYSNTRTIARALGGTVAPLPAALAPWAERWGIETQAQR